MDLPNIHCRPANEDINALPQQSYDGPINIIRSSSEWQKALGQLEKETILGFDTETRPSFQKGVHYSPALIQLASSNAVYLIQLRFMRFGKSLARLLSNPNIIKAGVAINADMLELGKLFPFKAQRIVDLGEMSKYNNLPNHGLRNLAASLFGWRITKNEQCSNWNVFELSKKQILYAATEACLFQRDAVRGP